MAHREKKSRKWSDDDGVVGKVHKFSVLILPRSEPDRYRKLEGNLPAKWSEF